MARLPGPPLPGRPNCPPTGRNSNPSRRPNPADLLAEAVTFRYSAILAGQGTDLDEQALTNSAPWAASARPWSNCAQQPARHPPEDPVRAVGTGEGANSLDCAEAMQRKIRGGTRGPDHVR